MSAVEASRIDDTRSRLILTAARLIHAGSYRAVGVKSICTRADVHKGSFYHFFESKQALMLSVVEMLWERYQAKSLRSCLDTSMPPRRRIEGIFDYAYDIHAAERVEAGHVLGCVFGNLAAEASTLDEGIRTRLQQIFEEWVDILVVPLADAYERGEIDLAIPPREAAWELLSSFQGIMLVSKARNDPELILRGGRAVTTRLWGARVDG
jgi:TetR/AcrR family transcriptional repressor of nem operon